MSVYSTLPVSKREALEILAKELNIEILDTDSEESLLADILFAVTSKNQYSPYYYNNYRIVETKSPL